MHYVTVAVVDRRSKTGKSGYKVYAYGQEPVLTDSKGRATVFSDNSYTSIYVEGFEVYDGSLTSAPDPIIVLRD